MRLQDKAAGRAKAEAAFLRERLAELRQRQAAAQEPPSAPVDRAPSPEPSEPARGAWWRRTFGAER